MTAPSIPHPFIIYAYRLTDDSGNAPCIHDLNGNPTGILTLACCKGGQVRNRKDVWTGLRYNIGKTHKDDIESKRNEVYLMGIYKNTLLYFAQITEILLMEDYYAPDSQYDNRMDSIYLFADGKFTRNALNPCFHPKNAPNRHRKDQLGKYVLISNRFAYWGKDSKEIPEDVLSILPKFRESKSYKNDSPDGHGERIMGMIKGLWEFKGSIQNEPHSPKKTCHRKGCAIK